MELVKDVIEGPFAVDQVVVYPRHGVGHVKSVVREKVKNEEVLYYEIRVSDMDALVPIHKAKDLGIRMIVTTEESERALGIVGSEQEPYLADWKMRYQMNADLLRSGSIHDIAQVVRMLYHRNKQKELPIMEKKQYDRALRLMIDEISHSLAKERDEVEQIILDRLESE